MQRLINIVLRHLKKITVFVIGGTVVLFGVILIFTPGPALIVIPAGIGILALEFEWARRLLRRMRDGGRALSDAITSQKRR